MWLTQVSFLLALLSARALGLSGGGAAAEATVALPRIAVLRQETEPQVLAKNSAPASTENSPTVQKLTEGKYAIFNTEGEEEASLVVTKNSVKASEESNLKALYDWLTSYFKRNRSPSQHPYPHGPQGPYDPWYAYNQDRFPYPPRPASVTYPYHYYPHYPYDEYNGYGSTYPYGPWSRFMPKLPWGQRKPSNPEMNHLKSQHKPYFHQQPSGGSNMMDRYQPAEQNFPQDGFRTGYPSQQGYQPSPQNFPQDDFRTGYNPQQGYQPSPQNFPQDDFRTGYNPQQEYQPSAANFPQDDFRAQQGYQPSAQTVPQEGFRNQYPAQQGYQPPDNFPHDRYPTQQEYQEAPQQSGVAPAASDDDYKVVYGHHLPGFFF